jgi:hypothetical protein
VVRIALSLLSVLPGQVGGAETYVRALVRHLPEVAGEDELLLSISAAGALYVPATWLISIWARSSIDGEVVAVIRILCLGLAVNGATPIAFPLMNGIGRPETNTGFMMAGIVLFYGILAVFRASGLDLKTFAMAMSVTFLVNEIAYLVFSEMVVWRSWLAVGASRMDERA